MNIGSLLYKRLGSFKKTGDELSKRCVVLLAAMIPLSTVGAAVAATLLVVTWLLGGNIHEKARVIWKHPVFRVTFFLFFVFVIGAFYSPASFKDVSHMLGKISKVLFIPFLLPLMGETKWRRLMVSAFLIAVLLTVFLSLLKMFGGPFILEGYTKTGSFKDPIFTNLMMAFTSFCVAHYTYASQNSRRRMLGLGLLAALIFYVLFVSPGRSGYVVFAVLWILFCIQRLTMKQCFLGVFAFLFVLGAASFFSTPFQQRVAAVSEDVAQHYLGNSQTSVGLRLEYTQQTWKLVKQHWVLGYGTGSFKQVYGEHAKTHGLIPSSNPHDEYLNIFFQVGLMGLIAFLGLFVWLFHFSYKLSQPENWVLQGIVVTMAIGCLANSWLMDFTSGWFFVFVTAFCLSAPVRCKEDKVCE